MRKEVLAATVLFVILAFSEVPGYAFVIGPNPATDDGNYELYGPHVKGIDIMIYSDTTAEWTAMQAGEIDIEDWPLDASWVTQWSTPGGPITVTNAGGEAGFYLYDFNNNATYTPSDSIPGVHNPTSEQVLREALAYAVNRSDIVALTGGLAIPIYTPMPAYMAGYINEDIAPGKPLEALTYGGYTGNLTAANWILDANGYTIDGNGWRIDPISQNGTGEELNLIVYSRSGLRGDYCDDYVNVLENVLHIKCNYYSHVPASAVTGPVFSQEYFNIYTGAWTNIGPDPDYLCDLYNGSNYYHPGTPPNYDGINDPELNYVLTRLKNVTIGIGIFEVRKSQGVIAEERIFAPLFSFTLFESSKTTPAQQSSGANWKDPVNQKGMGTRMPWSPLCMKQAGTLYPNFHMSYGFSGTVTLLNVIYSESFWDHQVLSSIYDSGARRDPYTLASWVPQLYKSWVVGTWNDPSAGGATKTSVTITLRPDVFWQDGQPFTVADVYYTLVEISKDLLAKGFPPPGWFTTVALMRSVKILDPYNIRVLLDANSVWAVGWVIGSVIVPKHIWKPIVDASVVGASNPRNVDATTPDPYIIGTGPFRWYSGTGNIIGSTVSLVMNSPGSSAPDPATGLTQIISPGYYFYYPVYVDVDPPGGLSKINISPSAASTTVPITITLRDMDTHDSLIVSKYVYVNGVLQSGFPETGITLQPMLPWNSTYMYPSDPLGHANVNTLTLTLAKKTLTYIKVAVHIDGPATLDPPQVNPWISVWINVTLPIWVTIAKDISGTNLFDVMAPVDSYYNMALSQIPISSTYQTQIKAEVPAPDLKVDGKDIAGAALAFGTVPGDPRWNTVADVNDDYKVDGADVALIALNFGY